ncbi:MAG: type II toxin-antitoxin system HicA family toxin [Candidatus Coatesbacteria bacterium]
MSRLPALTASQVLRKLRRAGFVFDRQAKGSHEIWYHPASKRRTVVPNHPGRTLPKGTLSAIIEQAGLALDEFLKL